MYNNGFYNGGYYNIQDIDNLPIQDIRYINSEAVSTIIVPPNKKTLFLDKTKMVAFVKFADFNGNIYSKEFEIKEKVPTNNQAKEGDFVSRTEFNQLLVAIEELKNKLNPAVESNNKDENKN